MTNAIYLYVLSGRTYDFDRKYSGGSADFYAQSDNQPEHRFSFLEICQHTYHKASLLPLILKIFRFRNSYNLCSVESHILQTFIPQCHNDTQRCTIDSTRIDVTFIRDFWAHGTHLTRLSDMLPGLRSMLLNADLSYGSGRWIHHVRTSRWDCEQRNE